MAVPMGKAPQKKPFVFSRPGAEAPKPIPTQHSVAADEAKHQGEKYNAYLQDKEYLTQIYQKFGVDKEPTAKDVQTWRDAMQDFSETHGHNIGDTIPAKNWTNVYQSNYFALEGMDAIPLDKKLETMQLLRSAMMEIEQQSHSEANVSFEPGEGGSAMTSSYRAEITREMDDALSGKLINPPQVQSPSAQDAQHKGEEYAKWLEAQKDNGLANSNTADSRIVDVEDVSVTEPELEPTPAPMTEPEVDVSGDSHSVERDPRIDPRASRMPHSIDDISSHIGSSEARAQYEAAHYRVGAGHDRGMKPAYVADGTARDSAHYEGQKYQQWLDSQKGPGAQTAQTAAAKTMEARWTPTAGAQADSVSSRIEAIKNDPFNTHGGKLGLLAGNTHSYAKEQTEHEGERYQQWLDSQKGPGAETAKIEQLKANAAAKAKELGEPEPDEAMLGNIENQTNEVILGEIVEKDIDVSVVDNNVPEPNEPDIILPDPTTAPQVNHQSKINMLDKSGVSQIAANAVNAGKVASVNTPQVVD